MCVVVGHKEVSGLSHVIITQERNPQALPMLRDPDVICGSVVVATCASIYPTKAT